MTAEHSRSAEEEESGSAKLPMGLWLTDRVSAPEEASEVLLEFMGNHCLARSPLHPNSSIETETLSPELMNLYDVKQCNFFLPNSLAIWA